MSGEYFKPLIPAVAFALLMGTPYLVPHTGFLSLFAFVPLFLMADKFVREGKRHTFLPYYAAFLLFNIITTWWIWNVSAAGAVAAIILNALQMTVIFALSVRAEKAIGKVSSLLFFAVFWTAWEHIYYEIEISWPWLALGNAFAGSIKCVQWYEILGTTGGTLWILLCNIAIFLSITTEGQRRKKICTTIAISLTAIPLIASFLRYCTFNEQGEKMEIAVIQPNVDPFGKYGVIRQDSLDRLLLRLADEAVTPATELVVTPETFTYGIDIDNPTNHPSISAYMDWLRSKGDLKMLLGALSTRFYTTALKPTKSARHIGERKWYDAYNTAMVLDSAGVLGSYFKSKLVPGVEIAPYANALPFLGKILELFGGSATSYATQDKMEAIPCGNGRKVGTMICYESIYGDYCRDAVRDGAGFMTVMTNDGWWGDTPGYRQHFSYAALRAVEYRRDVIQAANTGTSGLISQRGDIALSTQWWTELSFPAQVHYSTDITPFAQYGDVVGRLCSIALILCLIAICLSKGKRFSYGRYAADKS